MTARGHFKFLTLTIPAGSWSSLIHIEVLNKNLEVIDEKFESSQYWKLLINQVLKVRGSEVKSRSICGEINVTGIGFLMLKHYRTSEELPVLGLHNK